MNKKSLQAVTFLMKNITKLESPRSDRADHQVIRLSLNGDLQLTPEAEQELQQFAAAHLPAKAVVSIISLPGIPMININIRNASETEAQSLISELEKLKTK